MFFRLRHTLARFMAGRYGSDQLNTFLLVVYLLLFFAQMLTTGIARLVLYWLSMAMVLWALSRSFSRNLPRRQAENQRFLKLWHPVRGWLRRQFTRLRDIRRYRYRRCPGCSAYLRLPIKRGRRTVTCARCQTQFKAFFL